MCTKFDGRGITSFGDFAPFPFPLNFLLHFQPLPLSGWWLLWAWQLWLRLRRDLDPLPLQVPQERGLAVLEEEDRQR